MKKFVPYEKMSKKQKREYDRKQRGTWQLSPVTRFAETDRKHYSRKVKHKKQQTEALFDKGRLRPVLL